MLTTKEAVQNLRQAIIDESLIQGKWSTEENGKHVGCALHQIGGKDVDINKPSDCPASVMPLWLARWLPNSFDSVNPSEKYEVAEDFASTLEATVGWTPERWERLRVDFLCGLIDMVFAAAEPVLQGLSYWSGMANTFNMTKESLRDNGDLKVAQEAARFVDSVSMKMGAIPSASAASAARAAVEAVVRGVAFVAEEAAWSVRVAGDLARAARTKSYREQFAMLRRLSSGWKNVIMHRHKKSPETYRGVPEQNQ